MENLSCHSNEGTYISNNNKISNFVKANAKNKFASEELDFSPHKFRLLVVMTTNQFVRVGHKVYI